MSEFYNNEKALMFGVRFPKTIIIIISVGSLLSSLSNMMLGITHPLNFMGYVVSFGGLLVLLVKKTKELLHFFLAVAIVIYCPCVYIITEGFRGSNPMFAVAGVVLLIVLYSERIKWILVSLECTIYLSLSAIQMYRPSWFVTYADEQARLTAMCVSLVLSFVGCSVFINTLITVFEKKNSDNQELMKKLTKANHNLEELSIRDSLTGIFNRRYLLKISEELIKDYERMNSQMSVLMIDIDYFKKVNDTYGHVFGDWVLVRVSEMIKEGLRGTDILARYGGEEFSVILPNTELKDATQIAERVRKHVASMRNRKGGAVTVSIGVAEYQPGQSMVELIECADKCLYEAKRRGRDRVVFEMEDTESLK